MRVDLLSTAGIKAWGTMPATDLERRENAEGESNGVSEGLKGGNNRLKNSTSEKLKNGVEQV